MLSSQARALGAPPSGLTALATCRAEHRAPDAEHAVADQAERLCEDPSVAPRGRADDWLTVDQLLAAARDGLERLTPADALASRESGAVLVDIRSDTQRLRDGEIPGARRHPRNVLEWRSDPDCEHCDPEIARRDVRVILVCDEGYQSSLAAATIRQFGVDATDVIGGFQAWRAAGFPIEASAQAHGDAGE
jgi:rhodanese-related sulfurtransferase